MKSQIFLDRVIGIPISIIFAFFARIIGKMLRLNHDINKINIKNIAIFKFYGLGSIIQSFHSINLIRMKYPDAKILYITKFSNKDIFLSVSNIDKVILISDKNLIIFFFDIIRSLFFLWTNKIDLFFDLEIYSSFSTLYSTLSFAKNRYGFFRKFTFYKNGLYTHLLYFNPQYHISEIYNRLFNLADVPISKNYNINLKQFNAIETLKKFNLPAQEYIVINPNASDLMQNRKLPIDTWNKILEVLIKTIDKKICVVGSPNEVKYVDKIISENPSDNIINTVSKTTIVELITLVQQSQIVVTIDSGVMHIAFASNVPTICLFGPGDPNHYGPNNKKNVKIIYKNLYCSPCIYEVDTPPCKKDNQCMKQISAEEVLIEIYKFLSFENEILKKRTKINTNQNCYKYGELKH